METISHNITFITVSTTDNNVIAMLWEMEDTMNPANLIQLLNAKNQFEQSHPKFAVFIKNLISHGVESGSIIEAKITKPDGTTVTANMRVNESDLALIQELRNLKMG